MHWCPGNLLLPDAITKDNREKSQLLLEPLSSGVHKKPSETTTVQGQNVRDREFYAKEGMGKYQLCINLRALL